MPLPAAVLFSVALTLCAGYLSVAIDVPALPALMVIGTALRVYFDARRLGLARYRTASNPCGEALSRDFLFTSCFGTGRPLPRGASRGCVLGPVGKHALRGRRGRSEEACAAASLYFS